MTTSSRAVNLVPLDKITVLNPRVRNRRVFREITENISRIGLKRPITVSRRGGEGGAVRYDLVCGQGRVEAYRELGEASIRAVVVEVSEADCLIMSLVENVARRQHRPIDLLREVGGLRKRGYDDTQIAKKIGLSYEWVNMIAGLLEKGEERLLAAVEKGVMPISLAVEIARADDAGVQRALTQAYAEKKLRGKKLVAVRRLIEQRSRGHKHVTENPFGRKDGAKRPLSSDALMRVYRLEAEKQKLLVKKAEMTQSRLLFAVEALRKLMADPAFVALLRADGLDTMPQFLHDELAARPAS